MIFDNFDNMKLHIDTNPDGLDEATLAKVNALREERNKYNKMATDLQNQIDQTILEFNNFEGLVGKYIAVTFDNEVTIYCGPIYQVDRIYNKSCRVFAKKFIKIRQTEDSKRIFLTTNDSITISKYRIDSKNQKQTVYEEISKETFDSIFDNEISSFKEQY